DKTGFAGANVRWSCARTTAVRTAADRRWLECACHPRIANVAFTSLLPAEARVLAAHDCGRCGLHYLTVGTTRAAGRNGHLDKLIWLSAFGSQPSARHKQRLSFLRNQHRDRRGDFTCNNAYRNGNLPAGGAREYERATSHC